MVGLPPMLVLSLYWCWEEEQDRSEISLMSRDQKRRDPSLVVSAVSLSEGFGVKLLVRVDLVTFLRRSLLKEITNKIYLESLQF